MNKDLSEGSIIDDALGWLKALRESVSGSSRTYLDNTVKLVELSTEIHN